MVGWIQVKWSLAEKKMKAAVYFPVELHLEQDDNASSVTEIFGKYTSWFIKNVSPY